MRFVALFPFLVGLPLWLLIVVAVPCNATTPEKEESLKAPKESSEKQLAQLRKEAAEDARRELAAGAPKQYRSSHYFGGRTYAYDWDPDTGLQILDMHLLGSPAFSERDRQIKECVLEYNRVVTEWIAEHGLPPGSMKPRFVTAELARKSLESGSSLHRDGQVMGPQGKAIRWRKASPLSSCAADQLLADSNGSQIWSHYVVDTDPVRVAWSGHQSWFIEFLPKHKGEHGPIWHVDADGAGVLQTFDFAQK